MCRLVCVKTRFAAWPQAVDGRAAIHIQNIVSLLAFDFCGMTCCLVQTLSATIKTTKVYKTGIGNAIGNSWYTLIRVQRHFSAKTSKIPLICAIFYGII